MKKTYLKPDAEYIKFYSEEAITNDDLLLANADDLSITYNLLVDNEEGWT